MESTQQNGLEISDNAVKRIAWLIEQDGSQGSKLRIAVDGGGCSGFQYKLDFVDQQTDDDTAFDKNGITVLVDTVSLEFLNGSTLDYVETLGAAHFQITNPHATATCGCGNSFSV